MAKTIDRRALIEQLDRVTHVKEENREQEQAGRVNLAGHLLLLAGLDHERQYEMCRLLAQHLLETVPEPDDSTFDDE